MDPELRETGKQRPSRIKRIRVENTSGGNQPELLPADDDDNCIPSQSSRVNPHPDVVRESDSLTPEICTGGKCSIQRPSKRSSRRRKVASARNRRKRRGASKNSVARNRRRRSRK